MKKFLLLSILSLPAFLLSGCADLNHAYKTVSTSVKSTVDNITTPKTRAATTENLLTADNVSQNCPNVQIINELSSLNEFSDITQPKDYNLISRVQLQEGANNCIYSAGNVRVDIKLILEMEPCARHMSKTCARLFQSKPAPMAKNTKYLLVSNSATISLPITARHWLYPPALKTRKFRLI